MLKSSTDYVIERKDSIILYILNSMDIKYLVSGLAGLDEFKRCEDIK